MLKAIGYCYKINLTNQDMGNFYHMAHIVTILIRLVKNLINAITRTVLYLFKYKKFVKENFVYEGNFR